MDIRAEQRAVLFRSPDRPETSFFRPRKAHATREDKLASGRARQADYRDRLDKSRSPETHVIANALLAAYLTSDCYDDADRKLTHRMLEILISAGFDPLRVHDRVKKLRIGLLSPGSGTKKKGGRSK